MNPPPLHTHTHRHVHVEVRRLACREEVACEMMRPGEVRVVASSSSRAVEGCPFQRGLGYGWGGRTVRSPPAPLARSSAAVPRPSLGCPSAIPRLSLGHPSALSRLSLGYLCPRNAESRSSRARRRRRCAHCRSPAGARRRVRPSEKGPLEVGSCLPCLLLPALSGRAEWCEHTSAGGVHTGLGPRARAVCVRVWDRRRCCPMRGASRGGPKTQRVPRRVPELCRRVLAVCRAVCCREGVSELIHSECAKSVASVRCASVPPPE